MDILDSSGHLKLHYNSIFQQPYPALSEFRWSNLESHPGDWMLVSTMGFEVLSQHLCVGTYSNLCLAVSSLNSYISFKDKSGSKECWSTWQFI